MIDTSDIEEIRKKIENTNKKITDMEINQQTFHNQLDGISHRITRHKDEVISKIDSVIEILGAHMKKIESHERELYKGKDGVGLVATVKAILEFVNQVKKDRHGLWTWSYRLVAGGLLAFIAKVCWGIMTGDITLIST